MSRAHADIVIDDYLKPISGAEPCGPSLRYDGEWDRLRELRREDDASLPTGVWQSDLKRGDWAALEHLASELLRERSKDLMIAAWLGEAWLRRRGLKGIAPALQLLTALCELYPDELHPQAEDTDRSWRVSPLEWMVRHYSENLMTQVPLFAIESAEFAGMTLAGWQRLQQRQVQASDSKQDKAAVEAARLEYRKLQETLKQLPPADFIAARQQAQASLATLDRLEAWSGAWLQELAPSFGPLRQTLERIGSLMEGFVPMQQIPTEAVVTPSESEPGQETPAAPGDFRGTPSSREEAYRQLSLIADFLVRTEPHSPVPYVIRRAVEWGNQPLSELLEELINADAESRRLWKLLGVLK